MEATFANVYPSVLNVAIVGMMATVWIAVMKWLTARYNIVPGLQQLYGSI